MKDQSSRGMGRSFFGHLAVLAVLVFYSGVALAQTNPWNSLGPAGSYVRVVRIDPGNVNTIYAGLVSDDGHPLGGIYKSLDGGSTWTAFNNGLPVTAGVYALSFDPTNSSTLYAGLNNYGTWDGGVYKSTDGGNTWAATSLPTSYGVNAVVVNPTNPSLLYAGTNDQGLWSSGDGGITWSNANSGLPVASIYALAIDPQTPSTLYAGTDSGLFKSVDRGTTWIDANAGLPPTSNIGAIALNPLNTSTLFVGLNGYSGSDGGGVFQSSDRGATWNAANNGLPTANGVHAIAIDPVTPTNIYVGSFGSGAFQSTDGGSSWTDFNAGLPDFLVHSIAINPQTRTTIYAGTCNTGVYGTQ